MSFTHLQVRSGYSFMKSSAQIEALVKRAYELKYDSLALTDEEVLYGVIPFYKACEKKGIKPIIGLTVTFAYRDTDVEAIILAKSNAGYKELIQISSRLQAENIREFNTLFTQTSELIVIITAKTSVISSNLQKGKFAELHEWFNAFGEKFQSKNVYIGLERISKVDDNLIERAKKLSIETGIQITALHDVRYVNRNEAQGYDCLQAMRENRSWTGETIDESLQNKYLRSADEMREAFQIWQAPLQTANNIAEQCEVRIDFDEIHLPKFPLPEEQTAETYIKELCQVALEEKYENNNRKQKAYERLQYELRVIDELGFNDYFLIVADFVQFAKNEGIAVGPGRGSAAGSLVAYLLGITDVDPLAYNLLFERFLNPERVSMPDIDIDFSDKRRDEVIQYVREKYGSDYVAQIITFGTFAARSILREVMKTMNIAETDQTYILRHIPYDSTQRIAESVRKEKELVKYIKQSKKLTKLFTVAIQLEGLPRHMSVHAAGIVIGKRPLIEDVPLTKGAHGTYVTQYAMDELEAIGLLKMDILGLKNLTLIERIISSIKHHENVDFILESIEYQDQKTFALLQRGQTNGVFQFESSGMKQMLMKVKPTSLDDLVALNALYRPGPMEHIDTYTKRKHGQEQIAYLHQNLEPILKETYGVLVYQEQIMQIAHKFASFSLGEADILRRAISAKSRIALEAQKKRFIDGCLQNGYSEHVANELFRWIVTFADYGFNKSHSVAYSKVAYTLAYLKANYPTYFFAQLLSSTISDDTKKRVNYIREANDFGIEVLPPSINDSFAYYTVERRAIRMGLMAIKGIGYETIKTIIDERKEKPFKHLFDFVLRVKLNRNVLETLILAGAFDDTYNNRASLLASVTPALERAELFGGYGEGALFKDSLDMKASYVPMEDFTLMQKLTEERELLGTYMSAHPLKERRRALSAEKFATITEVKQLRKGVLCKLVAYTQRVKKIRTRRGDSMAFVTLSDETGEIEAVIFSNVWRQVNQFVEEDELYAIEGRASERNGEKQIIINELSPYSLEKLSDGSNQHIYIRIKHANYEKTLATLETLAKTYPGNSHIIVYDESTKQTYKLSKKYALSTKKSCIQQLNRQFGTKNVVLK